MNIYQQLKEDIIKVGKEIGYKEEELHLASIETPKSNQNGDLSTNIAMILAAKAKKNPKVIGEEFQYKLALLPYMEKIEVAGAGFINFTLKISTWHGALKNILENSFDYEKVDIGKGAEVNIEYVSANPTGPMHIGHARGAVYGDVMANLLQATGYKVTKEYYLNDAGSQIDTLTESAFLRYKEAVSGQRVEIPSGLYPGEYLIEVAHKLKEQYNDSLLDLTENEAKKIIKEFTLKEMLCLIKNDLKELGIEHEVFFSEQSLHNLGKIDATVEKLQKQGMVYKGIIPPPKGKINEEWEEKEQLLLATMKFGDAQDRPLTKSDGSWSYLAADLAYAQDKIERGYKQLIIVLGADHQGYVKSIETIVGALSGPQVKANIKICQLVNFMVSGVPVKMSKRSGTFTTVRDVINEVGGQVIRFMMLTRKNDITIDFDLEKVKEQSKDNPIFYIQYAHVRLLSIIDNCRENFKEGYDKFIAGSIDLSLLDTEEEKELIKLLVSWPKVIESAASALEPHRIAFYLINISSNFHSLWNLGKENNNYRFIINDQIGLTAARLSLVKALKIVIQDAFKIIGIEPLNKM